MFSAIFFLYFTFTSCIYPETCYKYNARTDGPRCEDGCQNSFTYRGFPLGSVSDTILIHSFESFLSRIFWILNNTFESQAPRLLNYRKNSTNSNWAHFYHSNFHQSISHCTHYLDFSSGLLKGLKNNHKKINLKRFPSQKNYNIMMKETLKWKIQKIKEENYLKLFFF